METPPTNGSTRPQTPKSPKITNWALTEYSASTPDTSAKPNSHDIVPEHFLLPNGQPDV